MSGIGGGISTLLFAAAGAVAASYVVKALPTTMNPKISAAIPLAIGIGLPMFVKNPIAKDIALGMGVQGTIGTLKAFNVISGIGGYELPMIGSTEMNFQSSMPTVGAVKEPSYTY